MHTNTKGGKRQALWQSGGWSLHISTHDSMLGSFVCRQEGTRVGKKEYKTSRRCGKLVWGGSRWWNVCVCVRLNRRVCFICVCVLVYVDRHCCVATLHILTWITHKRPKASYLCLHVKDYLFYWMYPPIICLSLSVLFNLFLVSAQWLPLTVFPSQM